MFMLFQDWNSSLRLDTPFFPTNTLQAVVRNQLTLKWTLALMESQNTWENRRIKGVGH